MKMYYVDEKKISMHLSRYEKNSLLIDFSKFSKIMCHDGFLIMQIMRLEPKKNVTCKKSQV